MPRMSKQDKAISHAEIIKQGSRLFREYGIEATSVGDIMNASGLTHGGFYRHFSGKQDLVLASIEFAVSEVLDQLEQVIKKQGAAVAITQYVDLYLSIQHMKKRGAGCPLAALIEEAGRSDDAVRFCLQSAMARVVEVLAKSMSGDQGRQKATGILAALIGSIQMARSAPSHKTATEILKSGRLVVALLLSPT